MKKTSIASAILMLSSSSLLFGQTIMSVSAANYRAVVAPDSIVSGWGASLAPSTVIANTNSVRGQPVILPTTLGAATLSLKDSGGATLPLPLYMISQGQVNYALPAAAKLGAGTITLTSNGTKTGSILISNVAPALFTADASGAGVPVGTVLRVSSDGSASSDNIFLDGSNFLPKPISLGFAADKVYLILYGTGVRLHSLNPVQATIGGLRVPVNYAGAQSQFPGFDQINLGPLPQTLAGKGATDLIVTVDGVPSNTVRVAIQ